MIIRNKVCLASSCLLATGLNAFGYLASHGPFSGGEFPQNVPIHNYLVTKQERVSGQRERDAVFLWYAESEQTKAPVVVEERDSETGSQITILDRNDSPLSMPVPNTQWGNPVEVFAADLNLDGEPDFIVTFSTRGCGLAAEGTTNLFLLSGKGRYEATALYSFDFGPEDLVRLKPDGPCYFIHNDLVRSQDETTKDGRGHSFWVYRLYRFSGGNLVEANQDDARFPKWVWYSFRDNHKETDLLTPEQKKRLLEKNRSFPAAGEGAGSVP